MNSVNCPICSQSESVPFLKLDNTWIVECKNCSCHYVSPRISDAEIFKRVQQWSKEDVVDKERLEEYFSDGMKRQYLKELKYFEKLIGKKGSLLDIGCSVGAFLSTADSMGFSTEGIEIGKDSANYAIKKLGLKVHNGTIHDYTQNNKFDIISMYEVVEHLTNPKDVINKAYSMLNPGGIIALSTPNILSATADVCKKNWWVINCPEEHIVLFNHISLKKLLENAGFEIISFRTIGTSPMIMLKSLKGKQINWKSQQKSRIKVRKALGKAKILNLTPIAKNILDAFFKYPISPLYNKGDRLFMYARKK